MVSIKRRLTRHDRHVQGRRQAIRCDVHALPLLGQGRHVAWQPLQHLLERVHVHRGEALGVKIEPLQLPAALGHLARREGQQCLPHSGQVSLEGYDKGVMGYAGQDTTNTEHALKKNVTTNVSSLRPTLPMKTQRCRNAAGREKQVWLDRL